MSRIAYVNGRYVPHRDAGVHIEDRGYQLSDGVYEVCEVLNGELIDERRHIARLEFSLAELQIAVPMTRLALSVVLHEVVRRNRVRHGMVYVQVTRGVAPRDHAFPSGDVAPALVVTARSTNAAAIEALADKGIGVITHADERWARVDIKSIALLPNVLAKQAARAQGAREAWLVDKNGYVTEGASSNAWIVNRDGHVVTRPLGHDILRGITRTVLIEAIAAQGLRLIERPFTVDEAHAAREAFVTSATQLVMPVVSIDGRPIGNGAPGLIATALRRAYHEFAERS